MSDWRDEEIRKARLAFWNASVEFARYEGLDQYADLTVRPRFVKAWETYRELLDSREADAIANPQPPLSHFQSLLNFLHFRRFDRRSREGRRAIEKIIKSKTPPPGGGGPWG